MATDTESLHALAFLYLTFSHATDGSLTGEEMRAVANKLQAWQPDVTLEQLGDVLKATVAEYKATASKTERYAQAEVCATRLVGHASAEARQTILNDLTSLAHVDGVVSDEEKRFIETIADKLDVNAPA